MDPRVFLNFRFRPATAVAVVLLFAASCPIEDARACGCFAPPDVAQPLVQAGEEILFVVDNGNITMHVKIRYSGRAGDFGWLLPLPSVPINSQGVQGIDIGIDELFQQLETRTQPTYLLNTRPCFGGGGYDGSGGGCGGGCGGGDASSLGDEPFASFDAGLPAAPPSPLVKQDSVGPYDFAILKADDKSAMLQWLQDNRYVVPAGIDGAVVPYIHPGAYFLALRLRAGAAAGDLQPVVLSYPSDLPMIPIVLTSVGAAPNMGILVWVLGNAQAVPRNYANVIINDAKLDWLNQVKNYNDVVIQAVSEAPNKHGFVTESATGSWGFEDVLNQPGRFDVLQTVASERDPARFVQAVLPMVQYDASYPGLPPLSRVLRGFALNGQFYAVVGAYIPIPQQLIAEGVTPDQYYSQIDYYLGTDRAQRPAAYMDIEAKLSAFDPMALAKDLTDRIVTPTLREGALFAQPELSFLTRLYTTLSPEDMTADPVFDLNPDLTGVSSLHNALLTLSCDGGGTLTTDSGFSQNYTQDELDRHAFKPASAPSSLRIERLSARGAPEIMTDNTPLIRAALNATAQGCATITDSHRRRSPAPFLGLCAVTLIALLLRRSYRFRHRS